MSSLAFVSRPTEITIPIPTVTPLTDPRFLRYNEPFKKKELGVVVSRLEEKLYDELE
jgi:hypothetical protein